jgi:predicted nucleic acid-binding protein
VIYVDTNILIDALRGYAPAIQFLEQSAKADSVGCSQVCEVELLLGAPSRALRRPVERLLKDLTVITPTQDDFSQAVALYRSLSLSHGVEFFDCLVAASALRLGVAVHSRNIKHLAPIPRLKVLPGYS